MLTHSQIWAAIDALAAHEGLTPSSLAKLGGLDPTTFNRSKRQNSEGQLRWPSTESIAKVLAATGASVDEFLQLIPRNPTPVRRIPFRPMRKAAHDWFDENGQIRAPGWDEIAFPSASDTNIFALEVQGDPFAPVYRDGDIIIASLDSEKRRGDRVFLLNGAGTAQIAVLGRKTATHLHLSTVQGNELAPCPLTDIRLLARIIWASQ